MFDPLRLSAVALDVMTVNRGPAAVVTARQSARLRRVVAAARGGSALYRERLRGVSDSNLSLSDLPVVTRAELMERFSEWVTDPSLDLADLRAFTAELASCGSAFQGRYMVWESSGTSGLPGVFVQDAQAMAVYDALEALRRSVPRPLSRLTDPFYLSERTAFVGATSGHFASFVSMERMRRLNPWLAGASGSFSILQPIDALVDALNAFAPTVIATYPTAAALLAEQALSGNLQLPVQEVWTGGESLSPVMRDRVQQAFGCAVRNSYGASEFLSMGWECSAGHLHVNADWVILEAVDEHYRPVPAGELSSTVLLTNLANNVQPLIRYDLGDQVRMDAKPCSCGSPLPVIEVDGRHDDSLVMSGGRGKLVTLLPLALATVLEDQAGVFDFQLRQKDRTTVMLRLGLRGGDAAHAMERCRTVLQAFGRMHGIASLNVVAELEQPLLRGRSGKVCRVMGCKP